MSCDPDKAYVRRKFFDQHQAHASPLATEAVERIGQLYAIESEIRDRAPDEWQRVRDSRSRPLLISCRSGDRQQCRLSWSAALIAIVAKLQGIAPPLHAGVSYGRFDHFRLLDTLRILPRSREDSKEPTLGIARGGLESAESLLWARYFMYTQLYFQPIRRIYDKHLKEFLQEWLTGGRFSTKLEEHLQITDSDVLNAIRFADRNNDRPEHGSARRIARREHFRLVYEMNPADQEANPTSVNLVEKALTEKFGADQIRRDTYIPEVEGIDFPIYTRDGRILSSLSMSKTLQRVPDFAIDCLYVNPQVRGEAETWLAESRPQILSGGGKAGIEK